MSLVCKYCGKKDIAGEAFNVRQGGFLCKACYRSSRLKFAGCFFPVAIVAVAAMFLIIFATLVLLNGI